MEFAFVCAVVILIFLNGATDAAGAVATAVSSGALSMGRAAVLSAVLNVAGGVFGASLFPRVGDAVLRGADFGGWGLLGGVAALGAAVLFTFAAWILHLPTSESHALLAAQAGAAAVLGGGGDFRGLFSVFLFMSASGAAGFIAGFLLPRAIPSRADGTAVRLLQVLCAAAASFLHGAQDLVDPVLILRGVVLLVHSVPPSQRITI